MPHLLAANLAATENPKLRWMGCNASGYLLSRGNLLTGYDPTFIELVRTYKV